MLSAIKSNLQARNRGMTVRHTVVGSPHRARAEAFISDIFQRHYQAELTSFAPNLMLLEKDERIAAVAGCLAPSPARSSTLTNRSPSRATCVTTANAPTFMKA